jgi:methyl-accepting chemotaxis protein
MTHFINNLKLAHKFVLLGLIAALMLALPSVMMVRDRLGTVRTAGVELSGVAPLSDALAVIRLTQQHRGLSAAVLAGNAAMDAQRQAKAAELAQALARLQASAANLGEGELLSTRGRIADEWQALSAAVAARGLAGPQSFARHTALIGAELGLLEDLSQVSGLVFESDPATCFLQTAVLVNLPRITEDLGQMRARGSALLSKGEASAEDKARFDSLAQVLHGHEAQAAKMLALVAHHDAGLGRVLAQPQAAAAAAVAQARTLVGDKILRAARLDFPAAEYFAATTVVIDLQFKLIDSGFGALRVRLQDKLQVARRALLLLLVGLASLGALAVWVMWRVTCTTTAALGSALGMAQAVAAGDLSRVVRSQGRDEIAQLLNALDAMNRSLVKVVMGVRSNAEGVATASAQIAQGNQDLSKRTEQQAAALEQTAATMDELGSTVRNNADSARQANELAQGTCAVAERSSAAVGRVVSTMRGIQDSARKIADIISVIDGIAFQTNILALNAAVEAARAGEQGRGFAVVAGEVRMLAQRSADAAREIKSLISASVESVEQGSSQVDVAGAAMIEVVAAIRRVTAIVAEISSASVEQSTGVNQVGEAVSQMDQATQQNAALVEQSAAAADSLRHQAQELVRMVAVFKLDGESQPGDRAFAAA